MYMNKQYFAKSDGPRNTLVWEKVCVLNRKDQAAHRERQRRESKYLPDPESVLSRVLILVFHTGSLHLQPKRAQKITLQWKMWMLKCKISGINYNAVENLDQTFKSISLFLLEFFKVVWFKWAHNSTKWFFFHPHLTELEHFYSTNMPPGMLTENQDSRSVSGEGRMELRRDTQRTSMEFMVFDFLNYMMSTWMFATFFFIYILCPKYFIVEKSYFLF